MKKFNIILMGEHRLIREACASLLNEKDELSVLASVSNYTDSSLTGLSPDLVIVAGNAGNVHGPDQVCFINRLFPRTPVMGLFMSPHVAIARKMIQAGMKAYLTSDSSIVEVFAAIDQLRENKTYVCDEIKDLLSKQLANDNNPENNTLDKFQLLSSRELQIIGFVRNGATSKDIASELNITFRTVESHRHNILKKLQIRNSTSLVNYMSFGDGLMSAV
ncbi:MAG TPA: response regulator transcription factor [Puia sp.]|nr:response regulator transcription factor [Puia sp.]